MLGEKAGPFAALDCGTNSTRLLVVGADGAVLDRQMRVTRLGEGVDATGTLARGAVDRTLAVLADYRKTIHSLGVAAARLVATSAVRDATNGADFLAAAGEVTGVDAELLSGEEEGRLAYAGATHDLPPAAGDDVVLDIGGGSTELVVERDGVLRAVSLRLGCVRLTERHLRHDPPTAAELAAAVAAIGSELDRAVAAVPALGALRSGSRLLGLAGTVSTLTMLDRRLDRYERDRVHHAVLDLAAVTHWCGVLAGEPAAARARRPGMDPGREDVIVGGAMVLREVMERFGFDRCLVSEADILDGLVLSLRG
ncbi:MAG TPA: Ppx/GppA phosphatase family protein [Acidimicrobiales bacterium]|nr:Ppx/GppA phosphatase family protein [Acidimicrobiales bacterium]